MKIILLILVLIIYTPAILFSSEITFGEDTLHYNLSKNWKIFEEGADEGRSYIWFKRDLIIDRKKIEVIPNLSIEIINIISGENEKASSENEKLDMLIMTLLLNKAPVEVLEEYNKSKDETIKFNISYKPSYGFVSNYSDKFGDVHDCYYITLMKENEAGVFIVIDCTQEIFPQIDMEIQDFLNSVTIK